METTIRPVKRSRVYGILGTLAWMLLAFIGGVYVGVHPDWVPNMPWAYNPTNDAPNANTAPVPASQPTENTSTPPQPQPSSPGN